MAEIQDSKSIGSVSGANLAGDVMVNAGNSSTGPNAQPVKMSNADMAQARINAAFSNAYVDDTARFNKLTSFNASHHGKNFERYYSHPKFKNLGFSPWRDNETYYNENSSVWDDALRGVKATGQLMGLAFTENLTNWGSLFSLKPNVEGADKMERIMSVGSSSRDSIGGKLINFGVNSGYTLGTVSEIIAEEVLLWGATAGLAATGVGVPAAAGTGAAATARTAYNIARLGKAFKGLSDAFRTAKKIETARDIFNGAKGLGKALDYITPFQNTRQLLTQAGRAGGKWDDLDKMAKVSKGFGSFYKDLVQINAVTSEAKLEGGFAQNDVVNRLYEDFRKENGRDPNEIEATSIYNQAREAGYLSSQMNAAGIYVSNKILLDRLFKRIPGMGQLDDVARRKVKGTPIYTGNWAKKDGAWEVVSGVKKFGKAGYYKQAFDPKNLAKGGLGYLSANLMEGTQEVYQEAIAKGITDYYVETYNQPSRVGNAEFYTKMKSGLQSQFSEQGLETFLSGFLMAGPVTAAQSAFYKGVDYARVAQLKIQDKQFKADPKNAGKASPYEEQLNREKEFTQNVVKALNDVTADPQKYFSAIEKNAKTQADLARLGEQAVLDGDTHAAISSRDEALVEHMITLLDAGKFDIFEDQIKSLRSLPKADLQEAFDEDPTAEGNPVADRMDSVLNRMSEIRNVYDRYQNMENPYQLRQDPMGYMAFEQGKHIMMRNDITYTRMGERMTDVYDSFVNTLPFESANLNDFSVLFSVGTTLERVAEAAEQTGMPSYLAASGMTNEVDILTREIENLRGVGTPEETKRADALTKKRDSLNSLNRLIQAYTSIYKVTQSANQTAEDYQKNLEVFEETKDILKKAYMGHLQLLAEQNGQIALVPQLEASFEKYADYWKLATDKTIVANAINMLNEPNNFRNSIERLKAAMTEAERQRGVNLEKALATFKEKYLVNAFFNELFNQQNVFVSPDEAEAFIDSNVVPTEFIDADTMEPVPTDSPKYKEILSLVDKYDEIFYEESGKRLKRTVLEGEGVARLAGYNTETGEMIEQFFGEKDPADKRTVKQLATEFGFSSTEPLAVDAKKVLNAIIKSEYASKEQKKLAQALLTLLRPGLMINFKTNHHTNSTYDPVNGVVVDARYSAEGFDIGTVPIEFSILNALMQEVVSDSLSDMEFNNKVTALREQLLEELSETDKLYFAYALQNNQQFVGDVMTNFDLQQAMTKIDYAGDFTEQKPEARTLWQTFIDAVLDRLAKIFPGRSKTLYQEAVNVITNKLVQPPAANATVTEEVIEEDEEIPSVPTDPELEARLRQKFDEVIASLPEAERNLIGYESWKMSDSSAMQIINEYKAEQIKKKAGEKELGKGVALTEAERKRRITELGYTVSEMNKMTPDQVNEIIQNSSKKRIKIQVPEKGKLVEKEIDFDYLMKFDDYIEEVVSDLRSTLNEKTFETYGKDSYIEVDALGQPIPGTERKRVSNIVKEKFSGSKEATDRGNIIDNLLRDFIANEITDIAVFRERYNTYKAKYRESGAFSDEMLNDLFDKFRTVNILLKEKGLKAISNIPTLWGTLGKDLAAGTIDLLAYDRTGKIYIIDLKTSSQDRRLQYKIEEALEKELGKDYAAAKQLIKLSDKNLKLAIDRASGDIKEKLISIRNRPEFQALINDKGAMPVYFYKEQDALQQNAYKELLRQRTGIDVDAILIFPIKTQKTGKIYTKADFQKEGNNHTMSVKAYDIHEELGLENVVGSYPENPLSAENKYQYLGIGKGPEQTGIPLVITSQVRQQLYDLGYSKADVDAMKPESAQEIIKNQTTKVKTPTPVSDKKADIIQTNKPNIQTVGNVTFGTANKQGQPDNNEDAVYVDIQNGVFILADGMGGEGMITLSPAQASKLVINKLLGNSEKNINELLYEEYLKNPDITNDEVLEILQKNGINLTGASRTIPSKIVNAFRTREDISGKKGFRSGATALKAVKTGKHTYTIEKVGDTVFFVVDKNGKVIKKHGLSDVATTQGYMFSIKDGKPFNSTPRTDNFTITLNEGETLVLATDFIETDKAIQDFIDSNFGKNLDFEKFQKNNKVDDSTFITIKYDAELDATQPEASVSDKKAEIERRRQDARTYNENYNSTQDVGKAVPGYTYKKDRFGNKTNYKGWASDGTTLSFITAVDEYEYVQKVNAKYDAELARELYKEMKAGKLVTDMTPAEQQVADKYITEELRKSVDEELAALEGAKPAETGTQTQLEFEELTLNVGDRVKVNTKTDGEGIIKEDRGDKVLLEDGRQVSKKNLIKLNAPEVEVVETDVAEKYRGKIIYTTPTEESISMLKGFKGVVYGPALYIRAVIGQFDDDLIEELRKISDTSYNADQWIKESAWEIVKTYNKPEKTVKDLLKLQGAIYAIIKAGDKLDNPAIKSALNKRVKNAWDSTMQLAQAEAAKGYTVVFDQNEAAGRPEVDMLLLDNKSSKVLKKDGSLNKSYETAIGKANKSKVSTITGKGLINVLGGKINEAYNIPQDVANLMETLSKPTPRKVKELIVNMETLSKLGLLESLLASQNITMDGARTLVNKAKASMKGRLDITDSVLQVTGTDPIVVEYEIEDGKRLTGIIKSNNGIELEIVPFQPNMSMEDLFKQTEITKFNSDAVPTNVFPVSTQKSVTVDPEVKTQSDAVNKQSSDSFANNSEALKQAMESDDKSAADYGKNFLDEINCKK